MQLFMYLFSHLPLYSLLNRHNREPSFSDVFPELGVRNLWLSIYLSAYLSIYLCMYLLSIVYLLYNGIISLFTKTNPSFMEDTEGS